MESEKSTISVQQQCKRQQEANTNTRAHAIEPDLIIICRGHDPDMLTASPMIVFFL